MNRKLEEGSVGVREDSNFRNAWFALKDAWTGTGVTTIPIFKLLVVGLVAFDFMMVTQILLYIPHTAKDSEICSPNVLDPNKIEYNSNSVFYVDLRAADLLSPPIFQGEHTKLCSEEAREGSQYNYCLPISGRKDTPFCTNADRVDLLSSKPVCYASVLHMLMIDVYDELKATGSIPFLTFGSLLGAFRSGSMIPFTEDADIGYVDELVAPDRLKRALWRKGYHLFSFGIWRVCVAPTHPLASRLYDANLPLSKNFSVPYVDLYRMKRTEYEDWDLQELEGSYGSILPDTKVWPLSQVMVNGMAFDTMRDPKYFLTEAYGYDFMIPKPRDVQNTK